MTISADRNYPLGIAMLLASGFFLGTSGLALRSVEAASGWQILFFRSASFVLLVFQASLHDYFPINCVRSLRLTYHHVEIEP